MEDYHFTTVKRRDYFPVISESPTGCGEAAGIKGHCLSPLISRAGWKTEIAGSPWASETVCVETLTPGEVSVPF